MKEAQDKQTMSCKRASAKASLFCLFLVLLIAGGVLLWHFLEKDADKTQGVFRDGFFEEGGNNNQDKERPAAPTLPSSPDAATPVPTYLRPSSTAAPTQTSTEPRYQFNQCAPDAEECCNGLENLCEWPVNEVLFGVVHNAMATTDTFFFPNHDKPMEKALAAGYRGVNLDLCKCQGSYQFCHGACGVGEKDAKEELTKLAAFLRTNPKDVLFLSLELNSDAGGAVDLNEFYNGIVTEVDGLTDLLYVHRNKNESWPTLGTMIQDNEVSCAT
jgi:hypothetical protein